MASNIELINNQGRSLFNPDISNISGAQPTTLSKDRDYQNSTIKKGVSTQDNSIHEGNTSMSMLINQNKLN
jgi:hypothetical protein